MPGADPSNNILITFDADTSGLTPAQQEVNDSFNKMNDSINKTQKGLSGADDKLKKYVQDLLNLQKSTTAAFTLKGLTDFEKQISKTTSSTKILAATIALSKKNLDQFKPDTKEWEQFNQLIKGGEELLLLMGGAEEEVTEKSKSLKAQLRAMKEELATIDDPSDPRFLRLATEAAQLEDRIGDVSQQVRLLSSDTQHIDVAIQAISGLAGAFSIAQGAAALLGAEGEDLQKALLKVNAAMSILQGLQQIQSITDKNSALNIALIKTLRLQDAAAIGVQTTATEGATVAQKGLNAAMAANPAALLILTLTTLVGLVIAFTGATEDAAAAQNRLNDQLDYNKQFSDDTIKFLDQAGKERIAQMKAQGATEKQIRDEERRQLQEQLNTRKEDLQKTVAAGEDAAGELQELYKNNFEIEKHFQEVGQDGIARDRIKRVKVDADYLEALKKTQENGLASQREIDAISSELRIKDFENQAETNKEVEEAEKEHQQKLKEAREKSLEEEKQYIETLKAEYAALSQFTVNQLNFEADQLKRLASDNNAPIALRNAALQKSLELQTEAIKKAADDEIAINELTGARALLVRQKAGQDIMKLEQDINDEIAKIRKDAEDKANADILAKREAFQDQMIVLGDAALESNKKNQEQRVEDEQNAIELRARYQQLAFESLGQIFDASFERERNQLEKSNERNKDLLDKKLISQEEYNKRQEKLKRQEAAINKKQTILEIVIDAAQKLFEIQSQAAVLSANPLTAPLAAQAYAQIPTVLISQGIALALVAASGFKKGGFTGNQAKDDIAGVVHGKEFVAHAEATERYRPALEAMNNLQFDQYLFKNLPQFTMPEMTPLPEWALNKTFHPSFEIDYDKLGEAVAKHQGRISDIPQSGLSFDENGVRRWQKKQDQLDIYLNKKYGYQK